MNLKQAEKQIQDHKNDDSKCMCLPYEPSMYCYKAMGFVECHTAMLPLVEALEISRGQWINSVNKDICLDAFAQYRRDVLGESK